MVEQIPYGIAVDPLPNRIVMVDLSILIVLLSLDVLIVAKFHRMLTPNMDRDPFATPG